MASKRIDVTLICGGKYHDFDFARLELLKLLHEQERIRVTVRDTYEDIFAIANSDALISYTCDIKPSDEAQDALDDFVQAGKRWYALHGTNSLLEFLSTRPLKIGTPRSAPRFMAMLGGQFLAHPPIQEFAVEITDPTHPLVDGIEPFKTTDEIYLTEPQGENQALLHCHYQGVVPEFDEGDFSQSNRHLVFYIRKHGNGEVLYLTLGHCRGTYDMLPLMEEYPRVERCSWELPVYYELLRRGIRWATRLSETK